MTDQKIPSALQSVIFAILLCGLLALLHSSWLPWLSTHHIGDSPDGNRTLSAIRYHVVHDSSLFHFSGMHYPYGDRVEYPDMVPLFSVPFKWLHHRVGPLDEHLLVAFNLALLLSFVGGGLLLFLLFRGLGLPFWFAAPAAAGILLLSPQWDRIDAHYGLAWAFPLPAVLYMLWLQEKRHRLWRDVLMGIVVYLFSWIHGYHMGIALLFLGFYAVVRFLSAPSRQRLVRTGMSSVLQLGIPVLLFYMYNLSDSVTDRSAYPYGFFSYTAEPKTLLFPLDLDWFSGIRQAWFGNGWTDPEKFAYLGLVAIVFLLVALTRILPFTRFKPVVTPYPAVKRYIRLIVLSGVLVLLYSMAVPLQWAPFRQLADHLGPLRQVRALGRFAWMGYYALNVGALTMLFYYWKTRSGSWRHFLLGAALLALLTEGWLYANQKTQYDLQADTAYREGFRAFDLPWLNLLDPNRHQAILPIPFFHQGSENFWMSMPGSVPWFTYRASSYSGVPTMGAFLNRTSLSETINILEFVHEHLRIPALLDDLPNSKSLVLLVFRDLWHHRGNPQTHLIDQGRLIYEDKDVMLLEWDPDLAERAIAKIRADIGNSLRLADSTAIISPLQTSGNDRFVHNHMDTMTASLSWQGQGGMQGSGLDTLLVYSGPWPEAVRPHIVSFWAFLNRDQAPLGTVLLRELGGDGRVIRQDGFLLREHLSGLSEGWGLFEQVVSPADTGTTLEVLYWNTNMRKDTFFIDEFELKPELVDVTGQTESALIRNNRWYPKQ